LTPLIHTARIVNDSQPRFIADLIEREFGSIFGKNIAVLGLSYKADVDDLRESPSVELAHLLIKLGASVKAYEPFISGDLFEGILLCSTLKDTISDTDLIVLAVGHDEFINIQPDEVANLTECRNVFDPVNGWNKESWEELAFIYKSLARANEKKIEYEIMI
jgi:UDP-N-acetyl-D-mannosaminuronic acid dehydrogenase